MNVAPWKSSNDAQGNTSATYYRCTKCGKEGYIAVTGAFDNTKTISGAEKCTKGVHDLEPIPSPKR